MIGFWKVHFRQSGRILFEEHASREFAIDAAYLRWLEDPRVWVTGPHEEVVESGEVECIYRERYLADNKSIITARGYRPPYSARSAISPRPVSWGRTG
jgi:hypothetical protein